MSTQERFEIQIEKIVAGGDGLGRHEGQVVFVPGSAPGERVVVEPLERRRDYQRAEIVEIVEASPGRRRAPCEYYTSCGGCSLMHIEPHAQVEVKKRILLESLKRGGGIELKGEVSIVAGPESGYRSRARFHVKQARRGALVGFKERGSHHLVDVARCHQLSPAANRVLGEVRRWLASRPPEAAGLVSIEILEPVTTPASPDEVSRHPRSERGRVLLHFVVNKARPPSRAGLERLVEKVGLAGLIVTQDVKGPAKGWRSRVGQSRTSHLVAGVDYQVGVGSFFQANCFLLEDLVREVVPAGGRLGKAVDLYCGVGLFTLPLAKFADRVVGVEAVPSAVKDARANARRAGVGNVQFVCTTAWEYVARENFASVELVVADPPRGGLERVVADALLDNPPQEIRYVSCDSASLGRDAARLVQGGFELQRLVLLDMFPNTHHFETVATFTRA